ncbi:class I SAM-dependent methyltransferase [Halalkalicoccus salilacus]|uniref:class I SAM-dependent methyltransferase n=1 Tax=Halalkalicoccus TaxID=332246 RepID=UPI002F9614E7
MSGNDFQRYLHAKRTVDDRALDRRVLDRLAAALSDRARELSEPLRVLEVGAGVGTMPTRLLDRGVLPDRTRYVAVDERPENVAAARDYLRERGFDGNGNGTLRYDDDRTIDVELVVGDAFGIEGEYDLLIGQAFLDLVDLSWALPRLFDRLRSGGTFYFPITFDGGTIFVPELELDDRIAELYHRDMDERTRDGRSAGHSRTGRRLFSRVPEAGGEILAAGSSDWVVHPPYPADEAFFLRHILGTIEGALSGHQGLDDAAFDAWVETRRGQIEREELTYVAHQLDVLGRV